MKKCLAGLGLALASLVAVADLSAHDTWLLPASMRAAVGQPVVLSLTSGMAFAADDFPIVPTRVERATSRLNGATERLGTPTSAALSLRYTWTPRAAGIAGIAVELAPKTLTLASDKIEEYFADINASKELRAQWAAIPAPKRWRESYSKHAVSYVRVGEPANDTTWRQPLGTGFEIVPEVDPTSLRAGQTLSVRVVRGGRAISKLEVGLQYDGDTHVAFATTDAAGRAKIVIPRAGRWLVNCTDLRRTNGKNLEWESDFATLTIAVQP